MTMKEPSQLPNAFNLGDRVHIDRDPSVVATVICMAYNGCWSFECAWFIGGDQKTAWLAEWRLAIAPGDETEPDYPRLAEADL